MKNNRALVFAALWFILGILALKFAPGNYFFYGFFVLAAIFAIARFYPTDKWA